MEVRGIGGTVAIEGDWVTITKKQPGQQPVMHRIHLRDITGTTLKLATRWFHGYVQFQVAGAVAASEVRGGLSSGRPPASDRNSLSISKRGNEAAKELMAAVEDGRSRLSR